MTASLHKKAAKDKELEEVTYFYPVIPLKCIAENKK